MRDTINFYIPVIFFLSSSVVIEMVLFADYCVVPPKQCPNYNISFYLFTSDNPDTPTILDVNDPSTIEDAYLIPEVDIKFIIHGYTGNVSYTPNPELRGAYFQRPIPVNIISIDYGQLALDGCYIQSVENLDLISMCAAEFMNLFFDIRQDINLSQLHIVAFSLGCHVAGRMANHFKHGKIYRITGLDPAAPLLYAVAIPDDKLLSPHDAKFVDAVHTNCGVKGKCIPMGHVDFYANGGMFQPGCGTNNSCSHARAVEYYAESINSNIGFWGYQCSFFTHFLGYCQEPEVWNLMGEYTDLTARGQFFFYTNDKPPYAEDPLVARQRYRDE